MRPRPQVWEVWRLRNSTDACTQQSDGLQLLLNQTVNFIQLPATGCVSAASVACVGDDNRSRLSHFACLLFVSCAMCVSSCCSSCSLSLSPVGSLPKQADATCVRSLGAASQARMCAEARQGYSRAEHPHHPCCCAVPAWSQALAAVKLYFVQSCSPFGAVPSPALRLAATVHPLTTPTLRPLRCLPPGTWQACGQSLQCLTPACSAAHCIQKAPKGSKALA